MGIVPATATRDKVIADALENSAEISSIVRTTAIGLLAIAWGFLVTPPPLRFPGPPPIIILAVVGLSILGLLLDWAQYLAGFIDSDFRRRAMDRDAKLRGWNPATFCTSADPFVSSRSK